ncbi:hypothetical protein HWQ46_09865 [Shewanella sp. D64]|uniref:hypothetical protein n=1 Tax=unclassified Shewanella TaxID=196818 RepID=UPI0022BA37FE|nr:MULTISPECIES: hypothetical protein [unclassified Shewanella]MEC4725849.1 hypothetical protein [Shewanella sp. D64]MEC4737104.1 hypothetical protein [Shewanella sp. E94]WBJ93560.1 hypothetical protein HWQ47_16695 [Shewanella sp. MTB7]WBJ95704.1 hypothetical protein HWQ47_00775 [Shewanella sp. MTB7]
MINVQVQAAQLIEQLQLMSLNSEQRKKLNRRIARAAVKANSQHTKQRLTPEGKPWHAPKRKRKKPQGRKLEGMGKHLTYRLQNDGSVLIRFKTRFRGVIARQQHAGFKQQRTAAQMARMYKRKNDGPPSSKLAKALKQAGYTTTKAMAKGRSKTISPTLSWIKQNLTERQCVAQLHNLRGTKGKSRWNITLSPRQMLGTHPDVVMAEIRQFINQ